MKRKDGSVRARRGRSASRFAAWRLGGFAVRAFQYKAFPRYGPSPATPPRCVAGVSHRLRAPLALVLPARTRAAGPRASGAPSHTHALEELVEGLRGERDVADGVTDGAPHQQVHDGEPGGVVGGEHGGGFLGARASPAASAIRRSGRRTGLMPVFSRMEGRNTRAAEREREAVAPGDHQLHVRERGRGRAARRRGAGAARARRGTCAPCCWFFSEK